jgi:hypothetical protein
MEDREKFTPDFRDFRMRPFTPFFIYEPLLQQKGKHNGVLLPSESKYLGKAHTLSDHYIMYHCKEDHFMPHGRKVGYIQNVATAKSFDRAHLRGECYALSPRAIFNLDRYMRNEYEFFRFDKSIFLTDQESPYKNLVHPAIKAWIYIGNPEHWKKHKTEKTSWYKSGEKWFWQ